MTVDTLPTARWTTVEWDEFAGAMSTLGLEPHSGIVLPKGTKTKKVKPDDELARIVRLVATPDRLVRTAFTTAGMRGVGTTHISWRFEDESVAVWAVAEEGVDIGVLMDGIPAVLFLDEILAISDFPAPRVEGQALVSAQGYVALLAYVDHLQQVIHRRLADRTPDSSMPGVSAPDLEAVLGQAIDDDSGLWMISVGLTRVDVSPSDFVGTAEAALNDLVEAGLMEEGEDGGLRPAGFGMLLTVAALEPMATATLTAEDYTGDEPVGHTPVTFFRGPTSIVLSAWSAESNEADVLLTQVDHAAAYLVLEGLIAGFVEGDDESGETQERPTFCSSCGTEFPDESNDFCSECGLPC